MMINKRLLIASVILLGLTAMAMAQNSEAAAEESDECVGLLNVSECSSSKRSGRCQWCMNTGCVPQSCQCQPQCRTFPSRNACPMRFCKWFSNACQNLCPDLQEVDPHILKKPAVLESVAIVGSSVKLFIRLMQMDPSRWNPRARFVHPFTLQPSSVIVPMDENPCDYTASKLFSLQHLILHAKPKVIPSASQYVYQFAIKVEWNEKFMLDGVAYPRDAEALLRFNVIINRNLLLKSSVCTLDSTLLWAYLEKGIVYVPEDGSNPYIDFELLTVPAECSYSIEESSFSILGYNGSVVHVTTPILAGTGPCGLQRWHLSVFFENGICSSEASDSFTLQYTLKGRPMCGSDPCATMATHTAQFSASLAGLENWCAINVSTCLSGIQRTYGTPTTWNETCCYFLGDTVYVRDKVFSSGLPIEELEIRSVKLAGSALIGPSPVSIYPVSSGNAAWQSAITACPAPAGSDEICHKFLMREDMLKVNRQLDIYTRIRARFPDRRRSEGGVDAQESDVQTSVLIRSNNAKEGAASVAAPATGDAAISSLPAVAMALVMGAVALAF